MIGLMAVDIGDRVGSYRLVSLIGEGGMGRVFVGEHVIIGRKAAIKVLRSEAAANPALVERLFDEARTAHRVHHPGIVEMLDCGVSSFAGPYLVMELLEGESLSRLLRAERSPPDVWTASILEQIGSALDAAHRVGVVHRDLKPGNVFIVDEERVKVLDFGIAAVSQQHGERPARRRSIIGTPQYMSPEQTRAAAPTPAMDIYALGVITFRILCGRVPFFSRSSDELLVMQREAPVPRASSFDGRLPSAVDDVLRQALAKKPEHRFVTCRALIAALAAALGLRALDLDPEDDLSPAASGEIPLYFSRGELPAVLLGDDYAVSDCFSSDAPSESPSGSETGRREIGSSGTLPSRLDGLASAATRPGRQLSSLMCPRCRSGQRLVIQRLGPVEVDACVASCGGIWLDRGELERVARESLGGDEVPGLDSLARLRAPSAIACPSCRAGMSSHILLEYGELSIDVCDRCGGIWLDDGELAEIQSQQARAALAGWLGTESSAFEADSP